MFRAVGQVESGSRKVSSMKRSLKRVKWSREPQVLLHPQIPKPLHGVNPRSILGNTWWNKERKQAYASTAFHCIACGVHKFEAQIKQHLEGHEEYRIDYKKGRMTYTRTIPLCHLCHFYIHRGRMEMLFRKRLITAAKCQKIISHGEHVLSEAGISFLTKPESPNYDVEWSEWRLVLFGKEYKPKFKSYEDWASHYASSS